MVSLLCPNCGTVIGEASHEDNYKEVFYHKDENDKAICKNCGARKLSKKEFFVDIALLVIFIGSIIIVKIIQS